jgi:replicative DNA helicase
MGDLEKSDKVYDKDGNLVNILNISKVKNKKCLKMVFDNNEGIISDFEHRWLVYTQNCGVKKEMVMTTQEIKDYNDNLIKRDSYKILKIENSKPLNNPNIKLPIDPYILGMWLGDGHKVDAKITQANPKVWDEIKKRGYRVGKDLSQGGAGEATTRTVFDMQHELRELKLLNNKHVPDIYLNASYEQRLDLLRGLMDSDGTFNKTRNRFVMASTKEKQADFYIEVASSLGLKCTKTKYSKKFKGKLIPCFNAEFTTDKFNPFLCRNENLDFKILKDKNSYRNIVSVEEVNSVQTKCIEVNSPSNTFLCGKNFLVTHNTNKIKNFQVHHYTSPMLPPFESEMDTALAHYKIQLPLYGQILWLCYCSPYC